ncbi:hypothetical protein HK096_000559, partial [Nowakowskiella sp. JEL0078]
MGTKGDSTNSILQNSDIRLSVIHESQSRQSLNVPFSPKNRHATGFDNDFSTLPDARPSDISQYSRNSIFKPTFSLFPTIFKFQGEYKDLITIEGSIFIYVLMPSLICSAWSALWVILYKVGNVTGFIIPSTLVTLLNVVLGLLLVFRNNTAYDRYWEGRRLWSAIQKDMRNLSRLIWFHVKDDFVYKEDNIGRK